jgi:hypothetical protein
MGLPGWHLTGKLGCACDANGPDRPERLPKLFGVLSFEEHLRQHRERQTGTGLEYHDAAAALSDPPPQTDHDLAAGGPAVNRPSRLA